MNENDKFSRYSTLPFFVKADDRNVIALTTMKPTPKRRCESIDLVVLRLAFTVGWRLVFTKINLQSLYI